MVSRMELCGKSFWIETVLVNEVFVVARFCFSLNLVAFASKILIIISITLVVVLSSFFQHSILTVHFDFFRHPFARTTLCSFIYEWRVFVKKFFYNDIKHIHCNVDTWVVKTGNQLTRWKSMFILQDYMIYNYGTLQFLQDTFCN